MDCPVRCIRENTCVTLFSKKNTNNHEKEEREPKELSLGSTSSAGDESTDRGNWANKAEFLLSCIGFAVGLGNLWRFPYLCMRNGGGAFLIPYFLFLFVCGIPLFFLELSIGQFSSSTPLSMWNLCPLFKGLGYGMIVVCTLVCVYYNMIIAWVLYYLFNSFTSVLPWSHCKNDTICFERSGLNNSNENVTKYSDGELSFGGNITLALAATNGSDIKKMTPAEEYWQFDVLELSPGIEDLGGVKWQLVLCLLAAWVLVFLCLCKGVKSSGKVVYVTATAPYVLLTILLVRGLTLDGALDGIKYYITPDFQKLKSLQVWGEAALQIFYSLGPAWGGLITMSSYNKFHNNVYRDALIVPLANCLTSFYGGFVIFSVIGFMAKQLNVPIEKVVTQGPGLAFVVYPEAIGKLPISPMWAVFFFIMLLTLGLDSQFAFFETIISSIVDDYPEWLRSRKLLLCGFISTVMFLAGLPFCTQGGMYVFQIMDWYCAAFSLMIIAFMECVIVAWVYGAGRLRKEIGIMVGGQPHVVWEILWKFVTPVVMLAVLIFNLCGYGVPSYGDYKYPGYVIGVGWLLASCSILPTPIYMIYIMWKTEGSFIQRLKKCLRPTDAWGPYLMKYRDHYDPQTGPTRTVEFYAETHYDEKRAIELTTIQDTKA